jgi:hypothetical protein
MSTRARGTIYVFLPEEVVPVWRPVLAVHLHGSTYRIAEQAYDPEDETWEFDVGDVVECERKRFDDGYHLVAVRRASATESG